MPTLNFEQFLRNLSRVPVAEDLGITPDAEPTMALAEVGADSLALYELLVVCESAARCDVPPAEIPEIVTLQDLYGYYLRCGAE